MPQQQRAPLSFIPHELHNAHVPLAQRGVGVGENTVAEDTAADAPSFPSLTAKSKPIMVTRSYRMPLSLVADLAAICKHFEIREESRLVRDMILAGIKQLKAAHPEIGGAAQTPNTVNSPVG